MGDLLLLRNERPDLALPINKLVYLFKLLKHGDNDLYVTRVNDAVYVTWHYGWCNKCLVFKSQDATLTLTDNFGVTLINPRTSTVLDRVVWLHA